MARATRIALDMALVSLRTVGPVVSTIWSATKRFIANTPAKSLVNNPIITKAETTLDNITSMLASKMTSLRDHQLPKEVKYLEKELDKAKKKIEQKQDSASKSLKPGCATAWRYAKVEMIPPLTHEFFNGPTGKKIEDSVSNVANNFIAGIERQIREIEAEKERQIKAKAAAIKAANEKAIAEAKKKEELRLKAEAEKKAKEAKLAKEKVKQAAVKTEAKTAAQTSEAKNASEKGTKKKKNAKGRGNRRRKNGPNSKK